jgi:hypothetical protein
VVLCAINDKAGIKCSAFHFVAALGDDLRGLDWINFSTVFHSLFILCLPAT